METTMVFQTLADYKTEELRNLGGIWTTLGRGEDRQRKCLSRQGQQYRSTTTLELLGGGADSGDDPERKVTTHKQQAGGHIVRRRTPSLPPIIPSGYEECEGGGDTSGYASDSAGGNDYLSGQRHLPQAHQHHHHPVHHPLNETWTKHPPLHHPWNASSLSIYSSCCGVPPTPDSVSSSSCGGGVGGGIGGGVGGGEARPRWGERGVGVGHLWTATPHLPEANLPLPQSTPPSHHRKLSDGSLRQLTPPAWIHRNGIRDGGAEVLVISHGSREDDSVSIGRHHQRFHQADTMSRHSCDTVISSPEEYQRTFIRGQNVHLEPEELADRERKRQRALEHQRAIQKQVEEKERQKREEQERMEREERAAEERLRRQQEIERRRLEEERRRQREKEEKDERVAQAMREALEVAERTAREAKARARYRHIKTASDNPTPKQCHSEIPSRMTMEDRVVAVAAAAEALTERQRMIPVAPEPLQVMMMVTTNNRTAKDTIQKQEQCKNSDRTPIQPSKFEGAENKGSGNNKYAKEEEDFEKDSLASRDGYGDGDGDGDGDRDGDGDGDRDGDGDSGRGSGNNSGGSGNSPPPPGGGRDPHSKPSSPKTEGKKEEEKEDEDHVVEEEQRPEIPPADAETSGKVIAPEIDEELVKPARVLSLRSKLVAKHRQKRRGRAGRKKEEVDEEERAEAGDQTKEGEQEEEQKEEEEEEAVTVALEDLTLVEGGHIEANQLSIVARLGSPTERLLTPSKFRPKRSNYEKSTQTVIQDNNVQNTKSRGNAGCSRGCSEERPKWGVNRPDRRYVKASDRDPFIRRVRCLRYLRTRSSGPKDSREDSRSPSPVANSKSSYLESSNSSMNRSTAPSNGANNNVKKVAQSSKAVCTPRIIQVLPTGGTVRKTSAGKRYLSIRGNIGIANGRMTNRPQMAPIQPQKNALPHQQLTSVQEVLYQLTALKHGLQMKQQEWEVSRSQTPYSEVSSRS